MIGSNASPLTGRRALPLRLQEAIGISSSEDSPTTPPASPATTTAWTDYIFIVATHEGRSALTALYFNKFFRKALPTGSYPFDLAFDTRSNTSITINAEALAGRNVLIFAEANYGTRAGYFRPALEAFFAGLTEPLKGAEAVKMVLFSGTNSWPSYLQMVDLSKLSEKLTSHQVVFFNKVGGDGSAALRYLAAQRGEAKEAEEEEEKKEKQENYKFFPLSWIHDPAVRPEALFFGKPIPSSTLLTPISVPRAVASETTPEAKGSESVHESLAEPAPVTPTTTGTEISAEAPIPRTAAGVSTSPIDSSPRKVTPTDPASPSGKITSRKSPVTSVFATLQESSPQPLSRTNSNGGGARAGAGGPAEGTSNPSTPTARSYRFLRDATMEDQTRFVAVPASETSSDSKSKGDDAAVTSPAGMTPDRRELPVPPLSPITLPTTTSWLACLTAADCCPGQKATAKVKPESTDTTGLSKYQDHTSPTS